MEERVALARLLHRAGQWEAALDVLGDASPELRVEIAVDRYWWRLGDDDAAAAEEALAALDPAAPHTAFLRGQLRYTRVLFDKEPAPDDAEKAGEEFAAAAEDPGIRGWATFWQGVHADNVAHDPARAAELYASVDPDGDRLLESYVVRHQGIQLLDKDRDRGLALLRRSLYLRATLGARPQTAAAAGTLAHFLGPGEESDLLLEATRVTAHELGLTWILELDAPDD